MSAISLAELAALRAVACAAQIVIDRPMVSSIIDLEAALDDLYELTPARMPYDPDARRARAEQAWRETFPDERDTSPCLPPIHEDAARKAGV